MLTYQMKALAIIQLLTTAPFAAAGLRGARTLALSTRKISTFHEVKLSPRNEKAPNSGADNGSGMAVVQLDYNELRSNAKWKICIQSDVHGFTPGVLRISKGSISQNGPIVVDFSSMLSDTDPFFDGCIKVSETLFDDILENPDLYYVDAQIADAPTALKNRGVRGQLVMELTAQVTAAKEVAPFTGVAGAHGDATISFEEAGTVVCIDATIEGFDPLVAHFHSDATGALQVFDFSSKRLAPGRFNGCGTLAQLAAPGTTVTVDTVAKILHDPTAYYFHFHQAKSGSDFYHAVRGQLDDVIV